MLPLGPAWLTVMCDAARRIARRGAALNASLGWVKRSRCFDFKDTARTEIGPQPRPPDGISTGRQTEYATVQEEYAAHDICSKSAGSSHLTRRLSGPALARMRECAHLMKT